MIHIFLVFNSTASPLPLRQRIYKTLWLSRDEGNERLCQKLVQRLITTYINHFYPAWYFKATAAAVTPPNAVLTDSLLGDRRKWQIVLELSTETPYHIHWPLLSCLIFQSRCRRRNAAKRNFNGFFIRRQKEVTYCVVNKETDSLLHMGILFILFMISEPLPPP